MFNYVRLSEVLGGSSAACERVPALPGLYAWFREVNIIDSGPEMFLESLFAAIGGRAAPDHHARVGQLHAVTLECHSELSDSRREKLTQLAQDQSFRTSLARLLRTAALLQAPLYVGKAIDLQKRVEQHLEPTSELACRLRVAGIDIRTCVLAYSVIEDDWSTSDDVFRLVEDVLTRICRPGFVLKFG